MDWATMARVVTTLGGSAWSVDVWIRLGWTRSVPCSFVLVFGVVSVSGVAEMAVAESETESGACGVWTAARTAARGTGGGGVGSEQEHSAEGRSGIRNVEKCHRVSVWNPYGLRIVGSKDFLPF